MGAAKTIIPTALNYSKDQFDTWAQECSKYFKTLHIDVVDGSYGKESYFDEVDSFESTQSFESLVVHLMVDDPVAFLSNKDSTLKKDSVTYIFKYAKLQNLSYLQSLLHQGYKIGVCFEIGDNLNVEPQVFGLISELMFVTVVPGKSGRGANLDWLQSLNEFVDKYNLDVFDDLKISLDGGFSITSADKFLDSRAQIIYANSFLRKNSIEKAFEKLSSLQK